MNLKQLLEMLAGHPATMRSDAFSLGEQLLQRSGIGYSQLNELLLMVGYDRISDAFFQYLVDGSSSYKRGSAITSLNQLKIGVDRFRQHALIRYGNFKFAFKHVSVLSAEDLNSELAVFRPVNEEVFSSRHDPVQPIEPIPGTDTYYLGYLLTVA